DGIVCLWSEDDDSLEWRKWEGIVRRADEWCQRAVAGFRAIDFALDAYVGFEDRDASAIVTFNLRELISGISQDGKHQRIHGVAEASSRISLFKGKGRPGTRAGRLFYRSILQAPPRTRLELEKSLTAAQLSRLRADLARVGPEDPPIEFAVLAWGRP